MTPVTEIEGVVLVARLQGNSKLLGVFKL